jgi:hypothetical protein
LELHTGLTTIFASQTTEILITNDDMKVHGGLQTPDKAISLSITNKITGSKDMHSLHCFFGGPGPLPHAVADEEERANIDFRNLEFNVGKTCVYAGAGRKVLECSRMNAGNGQTGDAEGAIDKVAFNLGGVRYMWTEL